jgi:hypothetical protein
LRYFLIPSFLLLATVRGAGAQQGSGTGNVSVSAKIGAKSYDASGPGSCRHEPGASIYNVPASLWMVEHASSGDGAIKHINLTQDSLLHSPDRCRRTWRAGGHR